MLLLSAEPRFPVELHAVRNLVACRPGRHFIDGAWCRAFSSSASQITIDDPATGIGIATILEGGAEEVDGAVAAARRAFRAGPWARMSGAERATIIRRLVECLEREKAFFCMLEALDAGHTLASIEDGDFALSVRFANAAGSWAARITGEVPMLSSGSGSMDFVLYEPIGVVGIITPWNAPLLMVVQKLAATLAAGCTAVVKPAELAPLSALYLADLCAEAGLPRGVLNIVTGGGATGKALADHPDVNLVSFTGSTATGKAIMMSAAGSNLKRVVLELGGKSPVIVLADADIDLSASAIVREITLKSGQYCAAGARVIAHRSIFAALRERMAAEMRALELGPGYVRTSMMGPMISERQRMRAADIVSEAVAQGATAVAGGHPRSGPGYFFDPTILTDVSLGSRADREEIFGPVVTMMEVPDDLPLQAIADLANDSEYGLSAKVWTRGLAAAHRLVRLLDSGQVIVNGGGGDSVLPFGGVKQSGIGRENGWQGLSAFLEPKSVRLGYGH